MIEFTGERVIPGLVNDELWAEHAARYRFAANFAPAGKVLDIGCGAGYGTAHLAAFAKYAAGIDNSREAVTYARCHYPAAHFLQASATALPFATGSFDLITAFEVIEHLADWRMMLHEARRVLSQDGVFLVSTPNKHYYAESRARDGANPFHVHEFDLDEFRQALSEHFAPVTIIQQNWVEAIAFGSSGDSHPTAAIEAGGDAHDAHFFVAICGSKPVHDFLYVPRAANLLRERERHIRLLEDELAQHKQWLAEAQRDHAALLELHTKLTEHLEEKNRWALQLEREWKAAQQRIVELQDEFKREQAAAAEVACAYEAKVAELELENRSKTEWAIETERRLTAELSARVEELAEAVRLLDKAEATVTERTLWAQKLDAQANELRAILEMVRASRWVRLGRSIGLGPRVDR